MEFSKKISILAIPMLMLFCVHTSYGKVSFTVKEDTTSGKGKCLPSGNPTNVASLLSRNNIRAFSGHNPISKGFATNLTPYTDWNSPQMKALARVVQAYDQMGGAARKALRSGNRIDVVFSKPGSPATNSRRYGTQIQIAPGNQNMRGTGHTSTCGGMDNHGLLAHELAHAVSRAHGSRLLTQYQRHMSGQQCKVSGYSAENRVEEFSEVVAAYMTNPELFRFRGASCQKAFSYMKKIFDEPNMTASCEARRRSYSNGAIQMATETGTGNNFKIQNYPIRTQF